MENKIKVCLYVCLRDGGWGQEVFPPESGQRRPRDLAPSLPPSCFSFLFHYLSLSIFFNL